MIGKHAQDQLQFPFFVDETYFKAEGNKPVWPDRVFWQLGGDPKQGIPALEVERVQDKDEHFKNYARQQTIYNQLFNSYPFSSANKERFRGPNMVAHRNRSNFQCMEPYFNEVCEAYFLQTDGADGYPTITELAALYFEEEDELKAAAYLLGSAKGGADCVQLDQEIFLQKPTD
jgi:hypothetical protein